jgi:dihydroorotate dehydrogenase
MAVRRAAYRAVRPLLFLADSEAIHGLTLRALRVASHSAVGRHVASASAELGRDEAGAAPVEQLGLGFRNRVGLAAGFDKDAVALVGWAALGFGFVEVGTVTPRPQAGNPRPRLWRLAADEGLVNRMGFNNDGAAAVADRIADARPSLPPGFVVGVNLGRNRDTPAESAIEDYVAAARTVAPVADYLAVNVSSPNTPGLRELETPDALTELLGALAAVAPRRPLLVKLSPDLDPDALETLVGSLIDASADGVILSNTTRRRDGLRTPPPAGADGGISGRPLRERMLAAVRSARRVAGSRLVIVASGGIGSGADAAAGRAAGAERVQLWTRQVYAGPGLIGAALHASR